MGRQGKTTARPAKKRPRKRAAPKRRAALPAAGNRQRTAATRRVEERVGSPTRSTDATDGVAMQARGKHATDKRRQTATPVRRRRLSPANLQKQLDQRTRELAEAQKHLAQALEQQAATAEILASLSSSVTDAKPVFDAIVGNVLRL